MNILVWETCRRGFPKRDLKKGAHRMPRRGPAPKRGILPDPVYNSEMVHRLINKMMWDGKKSLSMKIVYGALERIADKTGKNPVEVFDAALKNTMPLLEVRPRRVGGATYQVPIEVRAERRISLALRWLVQYSRARGERTMTEKLAGELVDAANNTGGSVKRRDEIHRMAEANRPFAHYRW